MAAGKRTGRGGPRPGSGRKPIDPTERKSVRVLVRLREAEAEELERLAGDEGLSTYIRRVLQRHLDRKRRTGR